MTDSSAVRKKRQRESNKVWLQEHENGITPDGIATALRNGNAKLIWLKKPAKKKVSKKK